MMRKTFLVLLGAAAGAALTLLATQPRLVPIGFGSSAKAAAADTYRQLNLFGDVFERVRADYVEKPDDSKLIESAINGMLAGLDPHSSYMEPKSFRDMQVQTRGEFGGLGIEVTMEDGLIKVVSPIDDTPAAKAGVMANDIITQLDGEQVQGLTLNQAVEKMRGPVNTKIKLTIMRKGQDKPIEVSITRDVIRVRVGALARRRRRCRLHPHHPVQRADHRGPEEGDHRSARRRSRPTSSRATSSICATIRAACSTRRSRCRTRSSSAARSSRPAAATPRRPSASTPAPGDLTKGKPVIVLINGGSASASEIVAGALQDHKRATIIGTRSFGKGSVQTIIPLGAGNGALRLTTARYYTPSGRSIQAKGIVPDIEVLQDVPDELKARTDTKGEASLRGHLKAEGDEQTGSQSYVPPDPKDDKALQHGARPAARRRRPTRPSRRTPSARPNRARSASAADDQLRGAARQAAPLLFAACRSGA